MVICYVGFLVVFLLAWVESVSLKHSTGMITIEKSILCFRIRKMTIESEEIEFIPTEKYLKLLYYIQVNTPTSGVKILRTRLARTHDTNIKMIERFLENMG